MVDYADIGKRIRACRLAKGMTQEQLAMLRLQTPPEMDEHGIGLRNLSARLRLLYGADAAMEITSTPEITSIETTFLPRTPEEIQAGTANGKDETVCGC